MREFDASAVPARYSIARRSEVVNVECTSAFSRPPECRIDANRRADCGLQDRVQGTMNWQPLANWFYGDFQVRLRRFEEVHINKYAKDMLCFGSKEISKKEAMLEAEAQDLIEFQTLIFTSFGFRLKIISKAELVLGGSRYLGLPGCDITGC